MSRPRLAEPSRPTNVGAPASPGVIEGVLRHVERLSGHAALTLEGRVYCYAELADLACRWAARLLDAADGRPRRVGILGYRSETSYVGVLASLMAGAAFVPLDPRLPAARTRAMVEQSELDALLVGEEARSCLQELLNGLVRPPALLLPGSDDSAVSGLRAPAVFGRTDMARVAPLQAVPTLVASDPAYLLFTSGSTGSPKGVLVTHGNLGAFLATNLQRYRLTPEDRLTQTFDHTFDLSIFDLFMAWHSGACVCSMRPIELLAPYRFLHQHHITVWFSVPSVAALLVKRGSLVPGCMPTLRWSLFCGEALPLAIAEAWQAAAPHATLENLYGPTELTIACAAYRWDPRTSPGECERQTVPIGTLYPGLDGMVVDAALREVSPGESGELCVAGPQTSPGYWREPAATAASRFDRVDSQGALRTYYRTGDIVMQRANHLVYLGRGDQQIKLGGHRVELGEVEAALLRVGAVQAAALAWPDAQRPESIVAVVSGGREPADLQSELARVLPSYMMPRSVLAIDQMPCNHNGKIDRRELRRWIVERRT